MDLFTALDWMRPMQVVEAALPPHDDDGVLAVPPEHGGEAQLPLLHALQHVPLLLQLVHDLIDAMCR